MAHISCCYHLWDGMITDFDEYCHWVVKEVTLVVVDFWFYLDNSALTENWARYAAELAGHLYLISPIVLLVDFIWLGTMILDIFAENVTANQSNRFSTVAIIGFSSRQVDNFPGRCSLIDCVESRNQSVRFS